MVRVANVEGLVARKTGKNSRTWYYRLAIPLRDQKRAGCKEIWQSLRTSDQAAAIERLPDAIKRAKSTLAKKLNVAPLKIDTREAPKGALKSDNIARLSVKLADLHYLTVKERDFVERAALFEKASADEKSFFEGRQVRLPHTAYMDMLLEEGERPLPDFLTYYWWNHYEERTLQLRAALSVGDASEGLTYLDQHLAALGAAVTVKEQRLLLSRALIQAEIDALSDIRKTDDSRYRALTDKAAKTDVRSQQPTPILSKAAAAWISEKAVSSWSARRKDACGATLSLFGTSAQRVERVAEADLEAMARTPMFRAKRARAARDILRALREIRSAKTLSTLLGYEDGEWAGVKQTGSGHVELVGL